MAEAMTFLQLSDTHLLADEGELLGCNPAQNLRRVVERITALPIAPRFCLVSGDLANESGVAGYQHVRRLLQPLADRGIPLLAGMGNHDDRVDFRRGFLGEDRHDDSPYYYSETIDGLRVVMLDSLVPGEVDGRLGEAQLAWLEQELAQPAPAGTIVVLHHPATATGLLWMDHRLLGDADRFWAIVNGRDVLGVLAGHCHCTGASQVGGTLATTAPAVAFQLAPGIAAARQIAGSGYNLCTVRDGRLLVNTIMV